MIYFRWKTFSQISRKNKKKKEKKRKKGRKNTTFLRRRGFSSRRVNDQLVVETNNDIMVIQDDRRFPPREELEVQHLSVPSLDLSLYETKFLEFFKLFPFYFLPWKIRGIEEIGYTFVVLKTLIINFDYERFEIRLWISNSRDDLTSLAA